MAVAALKKGKSAGADNITAEIVQAGGEMLIDVLTKICNKIWKNRRMKVTWAQSEIVTLLIEGQLTAVPELQNHQPHQSSK